MIHLNSKTIEDKNEYFNALMNENHYDDNNIYDNMRYMILQMMITLVIFYENGFWQFFDLAGFK